MSVNQRPKVAYGLSQPYFNASPLPIITGRDPLASDFAELGTIWINQVTPTAWLLVEVVDNLAVWLEIDNNAAPLGIVWHLEAGVGPIALAGNNGYTLTNAAAVGLVLPVAAPFGSQIWINTTNAAAGGFTITQNPDQFIIFGDDASTPGVGGSVDTTHGVPAIAMSMILVCTFADTQWTIFSTNAANLNFV